MLIKLDFKDIEIFMMVRSNLHFLYTLIELQLMSRIFKLMIIDNKIENDMTPIY